MIDQVSMEGWKWSTCHTVRTQACMEQEGEIPLCIVSFSLRPLAPPPSSRCGVRYLSGSYSLSGLWLTLRRDNCAAGTLEPSDLRALPSPLGQRYLPAGAHQGGTGGLAAPRELLSLTRGHCGLQVPSDFCLVFQLPPNLGRQEKSLI